MIPDMRTFRRPPSRHALRRAGNERGKPAAALAIITTIFAVAVVIKLLPPATREALLPLAVSELRSRALTIWTPGHTPVAAEMTTPSPRTEIREPEIAVASVQQMPVETPTTELPLTFDHDPGLAPILQAAAFMPVALATEVTAEPAEIETTGNSPLVMPFAKTGSALRLAFVKTGGAIKAAASGTAGVFVSNP